MGLWCCAYRSRVPVHSVTVICTIWPKDTKNPTLPWSPSPAVGRHIMIMVACLQKSQSRTLPGIHLVLLKFPFLKPHKIIFVSSVQLNDSISVYIAKWSPPKVLILATLEVRLPWHCALHLFPASFTIGMCISAFHCSQLTVNHTKNNLTNQSLWRA